MKIRIRRMDDRNIAIERYHLATSRDGVEYDKWITLGYYGTPIGLAQALVNMCLELGEDGEFIEQVKQFMQLTDAKIDAIAEQLSEVIEDNEVLIEL